MLCRHPGAVLLCNSSISDRVLSMFLISPPPWVMSCFHHCSKISLTGKPSPAAQRSSQYLDSAKVRAIKPVVTEEELAGVSALERSAYDPGDNARGSETVTAVPAAPVHSLLSRGHLQS